MSFTISTCVCVHIYVSVCARQCIFYFPFNITRFSASSASCGGEVKGCWVRWSQQEATSVVWCLTRMDCMTDAHGAHPGRPGHAALASRSAGVRATLQLSSPADSRKPIDFKHRLIIWKGNCKSIGPLILVGVHPLSFHVKPEAISLSAVLFLFAICLPSLLFGWIYPILVTKVISFCVCGETRTGQYDTQIHHMCVCVCDSACMVLWVPADKHTSLHRASCLRVQWQSLWKQFEPNALHLSCISTAVCSKWFLLHMTYSAAFL